MKEFFNMTKNFCIVSWKRLLSQTPRYWRRFSMIAGFLSMTSVFLNQNQEVIPYEYKYIVKYVAFASATAAFIVHFNTTDPDLTRKSNDILLDKNANKKIEDV